MQIGATKEQLKNNYNDKTKNERDTAKNIENNRTPDMKKQIVNKEEQM